MISPELRRIKANCWGSAWRAVEHDEDGRPKRYVKLTSAELAAFVSFGRVQIPRVGAVEA